MLKQLTTEEFIIRAKEIHKDKYDYSKSNYINSNTKIIIICSKHGEFEQLPFNHINGKQNCPYCVNNNKPSNIENFILEATKLHGNKYDYSKSIYKNNHSKLVIICPSHGEFEQTPKSHLKGSGCPKCSTKSLLTIDEFIEKANQIHNYKYDYSKSIYTGYDNELIINCSKHGEFVQTPNYHIHGGGCNKCFKQKVRIKSRFNNFLIKAKKIHSNKYNYDKSIYKNSDIKIIITCKKHGDFEQAPRNHLMGAGCSKCNKRSNIEQFIESARKIHGNKYDYSKSIYNGNRIKLSIICPKHGEFIQTPKHHLRGHGCPKCARLLNFDKFIERSNKIHNNKYDYSKSIYDGIRNKIKIICPEHGEFEQCVDSHLNGVGCEKCELLYLNNRFIEKARKIHGDKYNYDKVIYNNNKIIITCTKHGDFLQSPKYHLSGNICPLCKLDSKRKCGIKLTLKQFIKRADLIHHNKYDYSKSIYNGVFNKLIIICSKHGEFEQFAGAHLRGKGCKKCSKTCFNTTEEFINYATSIHKDKYDYSRVIYKTFSNDKIEIICKKHGSFWQLPISHVRGNGGCIKCQYEEKSTIYSSNTSEFIEKANKIHNSLYEYDKTIYIRNCEKVIIKCKKHGYFEQTPASHLAGKGCPKCKRSRGEIKIKKFFEYLFGHSFYKIKPNWLVNPITNQKLEIDVANENLNIYVEYGGKQHYKFIKYFHKTYENFEKRKMVDKIKRKLCKQNNKRLIEIPDELSAIKLTKYLTVMFKKYELKPINTIESAIEKFY